MPADGSFGERRFSEVYDPAKIGEKVQSRLQRVFAPLSERDALTERYMRPVMNSGWSILDVDCGFPTSTYHAPSTDDETKAVVVYFTGCEGTSLTVASKINALRAQGIAFIAHERILSDHCPSIDERYEANGVLAARHLSDKTFPLHALYDVANTPVYIVTESAAEQSLARNLLHEPFAKDVSAFANGTDAIVPYLDAQRFSTHYQLPQMNLPGPIAAMARAAMHMKRVTMSVGFGAYDIAYGNRMLGTGPICKHWHTPTQTTALVKEGRFLSLKGRDIFDAYKAMDLASHPIGELNRHAWISTDDDASCHLTGQEYAEMIGAEPHEVTGGHIIAKDILPQIGERILADHPAPEPVN